MTAAEYMRYYDGTVDEIRKALALKEAFDRLLEVPAFQEAVRDPAYEPLIATPEFQAVLDHAAG